MTIDGAEAPFWRAFPQGLSGGPTKARMTV